MAHQGRDLAGHQRAVSLKGLLVFMSSMSAGNHQVENLQRCVHCDGRCWELRGHCSPFLRLTVFTERVMMCLPLSTSLRSLLSKIKNMAL